MELEKLRGSHEVLSDKLQGQSSFIRELETQLQGAASERDYAQGQANEHRQLHAEIKSKLEAVTSQRDEEREEVARLKSVSMIKLVQSH